MTAATQQTVSDSSNIWKATLRTMERETLFFFLLASIGIAVALLMGQFVFAQFSMTQLRGYTDQLLQHSNRIISTSINTFTKVEKSPAPMCSDANLSEMRYLVFHKEEIYDIGRVQNGYLLCTANWGILDQALKLPAPQRQEANGDLLWTNVASPVDKRLTVDMANHGSVLLFTSPTAFEQYEKFNPSFSAILLTKDGWHTYRAFGKTDGLMQRFRAGPSAFAFGPRLTTTACDPVLDVCAVTGLSDVNLLTHSPSTALELALIGGLATCGLGLLMSRRRRRHASLPEQIRRAAANGRLTVVYQPLIRIRDGQMVGVEALARMTDETGNPIPPDIFIGVAEESGLIESITRTVIRKTLNDMQERLTGAERFYVGINAAVEDVVDPTFHQYLSEETDRLKIPHDRVIIELTERSTTNEKTLLTGAALLRENGYGLYIDDLGTGYSSLAYLSKLPISGIKVDKIFTQSIGKEAITSTIVEKICSIADTLGVRVVMEGVETQEQVTYLLDRHPDAIGQGYFWSKPVSTAKLPTFPVSPMTLEAKA